jgi:transcriptional regulator with XRE-family HTH domain
MNVSLAGIATKSHTAAMGRPRRTVADKTLMLRLGQRLRWVREAKGMTQQQIADLAGLHQTAWSLYERGLRFPDHFEVPRLLAKLRISREYLMEGSLEGVEADLAIRLAAAHPELVPSIGKARRKDMVG